MNESESKVEKEFLSAKELADMLNMSLKWVQKHVQSGRLPGIVRFGRRVRFRTIDIEKRLLTGQVLLEKSS